MANRMELPAEHQPREQEGGRHGCGSGGSMEKSAPATQAGV
jgi:hypothetical protein